MNKNIKKEISTEKRKSFLKGLAFGIIITLLILVLLKVVISSNYSREAYLDNEEGNVLTFIDAYGHLWQWEKEGNEDFHTFEKVKLTFFNNHTDDIIEDDILIKIEKIEKDKKI